MSNKHVDSSPIPALSVCFCKVFTYLLTQNLPVVISCLSRRYYSVRQTLLLTACSIFPWSFKRSPLSTVGTGWRVTGPLLKCSCFQHILDHKRALSIFSPSSSGTKAASLVATILRSKSQECLISSSNSIEGWYGDIWILKISGHLLSKRACTLSFFQELIVERARIPRSRLCTWACAYVPLRESITLSVIPFPHNVTREWEQLQRHVHSIITVPIQIH